MESQTDYMKRKLEEYRKMNAVASSLTHDLIEPDEIVVKTMQMFPGCQRYDKCCDESWKEKLERNIKVPYKTDYTLLTEKTLKKNKKKLEPPKGWRINTDHVWKGK